MQDKKLIESYDGIGVIGCGSTVTVGRLIAGVIAGCSSKQILVIENSNSMEKQPIDIETMKMRDENPEFDLGKYSKKVQRRVQKLQGNSFADKLKEKFRQQRLAKLKGE